MNLLLVIILITIILLLSALLFGLYLLFNKQSALELRMTRTSEYNKHASEDMNRMLEKMDKIQMQSTINGRTSRDLQEQMQAITSVMANAKARGSWGEYQLEMLVRTYLGDSDQIFEVQYPLANGKIADGAFHLPDTEKVLCIDSKFPMENYMRMSSDPERAGYYERELRRNIKKHIKDVASKYITPQTLDIAVLFIPSEAVYQYLCSEGADLMQEALAQHVMLVSPTTLAGVTFSLLSSTKSFYRAQNEGKIEEALRQLEKEAALTSEKAESALKSSQALNNHLQELVRRCHRMISALEQASGGDEQI